MLCIVVTVICSKSLVVLLVMMKEPFWKLAEVQIDGFCQHLQGLGGLLQVLHVVVLAEEMKAQVGR